MNIPEELYKSLIKDTDPVILHLIDLQEKFLISEEELLVYEDMSLLKSILKLKLIKKYKNKSTSVDFDMQNIITKLQDEQNNLIHDVIYYGLLNQNTTSEISKLFQRCMKEENNLFQLEILDTLLDVCVYSEISFREYLTDQKVVDIILKHIVCDDKKIYNKIIDILPKYCNYVQDHVVLKRLFDNVGQPLILNILCVLSDLYIPLDCNKYTIILENKFWELLQNNITSSIFLIKKQSLHLLQKAITVFFANSENTEKIKSKINILDFISIEQQEIQTAWKYFFILCDTVNEKQMHLIEPTFKLYSNLKPLHESWKLCIVKQFLQHSHPAVVKLTVIQILSNSWAYDMVLLVNGLSHINLYEKNNKYNISDMLFTFISKFNTAELGDFIDVLLVVKMNEISLFHIIQIIELCDIFGEDIFLNLILLLKSIKNNFLKVSLLESFIDFMGKMFNQFEFERFEKMEVVINELLNFYEICFSAHGLDVKINSISKISKLYDVISDDEQKLVEQLFNNKLTDLKFTSFILFGNFKEKFLLKCEEVLINTCNSAIQDSEKLEKLQTILLVIKENKMADIYLSIKTLEVVSKTIFALCCSHNNENENINILNILLNIMLQDKYMKERSNLHKNLIDFQIKLYKSEKFNLYFVLLKNIFILSIPIELFNSTLVILNYKNYDKNNYDICGYYLTKIYVQLEALKKEKNYNNSIWFINTLNTYLDIGGPECQNCILEILHKINFDVFLNNKIVYEALKYFLQRLQDELFCKGVGSFNQIYFKIITKKEILNSDILLDVYLNFGKKIYETKNINYEFAVLRKNYFYYINIADDPLNLKFILNYLYDVLIESILHAPLFRKEQRIEFDTCMKIKENGLIQLDAPCENDAMGRVYTLKLLLLYFDRCNDYDLQTRICETLMELYNKNAGKRYFANSQLDFQKLRTMQFLNILLKKFHTENFTLLINIKEWLYKCLNEAHQPCVKILIQYLIVQVLRKGDVERAMVDIMKKATCMTGTSVSSVFPILYHLSTSLKYGQNDSSSTVIQDCLDLLLEFTMGPHFNVRYAAQIAIKQIIDFIYKYFNKLESKYRYVYKSICKIIKETSKDNVQDPFQLSYLDLRYFLSYETIYCDLPRLTGVQNTEWMVEKSLIDFDMEIGFIKIRNTDRYLYNLIAKIKPVSEENIEFNYTNVQKKIEPWKVNKEVYPGKLIVVASLIDKLPNLGGLSRTCEVFGVEKYVLNNGQMVKNKEYQSLSMSSEKWVDTEEVKISHLSNYLRRMKREGYAIVGAEQTAESVKLDEHKFEKNTVLVLGNEKEGVPANLIHLMDVCLEIPQFGQIRSLNVHVAGAVFIWEYTKQHCHNN